MAAAPPNDVRPYIVRTYDRWIILVLVLVAGWLLFRPVFAYTVFYRGLSFERMLQLGAAEHYYRKSIGVDPHIPESWLALGQLDMMRMHSRPDAYAGALDTLSRGADANPRSGVLPFFLCRTYYEAGHDYAKALAACKRSVANDPSLHFAWDYAGWASLQLGDRSNAVNYWRESLKHAHNPSVEAALKKYSPNAR